MKKILLPILLLLALNSYAEQANEGYNTALSDDTIKKIQAKQFDYKKCVSEQMQQPDKLLQDSKSATNAIIHNCEPILSQMREIYVAEKVPLGMADQHLKQMRIQVTRNVLQNMMTMEAVRSSTTGGN